MHIKDAAALSGLSIDTIRFYEKAGMLPTARRDKRGWRDFDPDTLEWLRNLARLRSTGMPLKDVKQFAILVHAKDANRPSAALERLDLLMQHSSRLKERQKDLDQCATYLKTKIAIYEKLGKNKS